MCYLVAMALHLLLLVSSAGFVLGGNNQVNPVLAVKNSWTNPELYNTLISSFGITGLILGSLLSSKFVHIGRRKCALIFLTIIELAVIPTIIWPDIVVICIFRCIFGFAAGANITCSAMILGETVPKAHSQTFAATINLGIISGLMVCLFSGLPLLDLTDQEAIDN